MQISVRGVLLVVFLICVCLLQHEVQGTRLRFVRDQRGDDGDIEADGGGEGTILHDLKKYGIDMEMSRVLTQYCAAVRSCPAEYLRDLRCIPNNETMTSSCPANTKETHPSNFDVIDVVDDTRADMTVLIGANHDFRIIAVAFRGTATINNMLEDLSIQPIPYPMMKTFQLKHKSMDNDPFNLSKRSFFGKFFEKGTFSSSTSKSAGDAFNITTIDEETVEIFLNGSLVHSGFYSVWTSVAPALMKVIDEAKQMYPDYRLVFTGYSLGGAIASLGATALRLNGTHAVDAIYTYGEPKLGNDIFAEFVQHFVSPRRFRFVNHNDIVPRLPPPGLGVDYQHAGIEVFLDRFSNVAKICDKHCKDPDYQGTLSVFRYSVLEHFTYLNTTMHTKCGFMTTIL